MQSTRKKPTLLFASVAFVAVAAACGQVTGLSDDYDFGLVVEGGAKNDAGDGGGGGDSTTTSDAPSDGNSVTDAPRDATNACSAGQTATAVQTLSTYNATATCKTCLASACCTDVAACDTNQSCSRALACKLDCTTRPSGDRTQCFKSCDNSGGGPPPLYTNGIGACGASACKAQCGLQ